MAKKGGGSAPKAPDPIKTAAAQTGSNIGTAIATQAMNVNQVTPDGSLTYGQSGTYDYVDPLSKRVYKIPLWTATTKLSDSQQAIKNQSDAAELNLASLANSQSGRLQGLLDRPLDLNNEAIEGRLWDLGSSRLRPQIEQDRARAETNLANRGIRLGSKAYETAMSQQGQKENDLWNQLFLTGRGQAVNEILTERNQPLNEIAALLSGSAVNQPNFVNTSNPGVANVDYAGLVNNKYQADLAAWQQKQQDKNSMLGGMFGLAGTALMYSDKRLKEDIHKVGETEDDLGLYTYRYKGDGKKRLGLIAQDVEKKMPSAVSKDSHGFRKVNYRKALHLGERARAA